MSYACLHMQLNFGRHCSNLASIALDVAHSLQASAMKQLQAGSNPSLQECAETLTALTVQLVEKYSPSGEKRYLCVINSPIQWSNTDVNGMCEIWVDDI